MTTIISCFLVGEEGAAVALDDRIILHTGGWLGYGAVTSVYLIDTVSGDITPRLSMNTPRDRHRLVLLGSEAIAIAGSVEKYSLNDDQWTNMPELSV